MYWFFNIPKTVCIKNCVAIALRQFSGGKSPSLINLTVDFVYIFGIVHIWICLFVATTLLSKISNFVISSSLNVNIACCSVSCMTVHGSLGIALQKFKRLFINRLSAYAAQFRVFIRAGRHRATHNTIWITIRCPRYLDNTIWAILC